MKKITALVELRAAIAAALCLSIIYPQLRVSYAATPGPAADVKSESQLRAEASRYDAAIRAIAGITAMKFDTPEDLKKAVAILDRERPNLKLHRSQYLVIGLSDSSFVSAVRKKLPNKQAAEAFVQQLTADAKIALTVDGAPALKTRLQQRIAADAATLRKAGERLKEAAAKFKKASQASLTPRHETTAGFKLIKAGYSDAPLSIALPEPAAMPVLDPASIAVIIVTVIVLTAFYYGLFTIIGPYYGIGTEEDKDQVAECQQETDGRYASCVAEARDLPSGLPFFLRETAQAACYADWLVRQAACLALIV